MPVSPIKAGRVAEHRRRGKRAREARATFGPALLKPVDIASLAFFRIAFGVIMAWEVFRFFAGGRISRYYMEPEFLFTYFGFHWVQPWPGNGMYVHFVGLGVLAILIAVGLFYRLSAALFFAGFTYVFLLDQSRYLNHFYLISLIGLLMVFAPAHRRWSLDARWRVTEPSKTAPAWALWLLRAQIGCVYFFGGIAKLNGDWLRGEPVRSWLAERTDLPLVGPIMDGEWLVWFFAFGGLFFDLLIVPALLWPKTRPWAFAAAAFFHLTNAFVFNIGIFPWFMLAATTLFFAPDWPRRILPRSRSALHTGSASNPRMVSPPLISCTVWCVAIYLAVQVLAPLRHWLYPGNVNWTEEGHRFAWRMKLRDKEGETQFFVTDTASGQTQVVTPEKHLDRAQVDEMSTRPDMILQFAHYLADEAQRAGASNVTVRALAKVSLNGRAPQLLIDPTVDLAAQQRSLRPAKWILPLMEPLPWPPGKS